MKLLRSWPAVVPPGRSYVCDGMDRLEMFAYDYAVLADVGDDILLIEWDIAVGAEELEAFAKTAREQPDRMLAAPYRLYDGHSVHIGRSVWSAWTYHNDDQRNGHMVQAEPGQPTAHIVGLGMTYLPAALIRRYLAERKPDWGFSDIAFCGWHFREVEHEIRLDWDARPVHLHYDVRKVAI